MLRSGYSSETVLRVLSNRRLAGSLNSAGEKELTNVNASPALIDALKSGSNSASAEEMAQARQLAAAQKVSVQNTIAAQQDASRQIAAQQSRNTRIVVAPAPGDITSRWTGSGRPSALERQNAATSGAFEQTFKSPSDRQEEAAEKRAEAQAAQAAREAWCVEHPVECAREQAAREEAARRGAAAARREADEIKSKYESAIDDVKFTGRPVDTPFGLPIPNSPEAQIVQSSYQSKLDDANRDAKQQAVKRQADQEYTAKRQAYDEATRQADDQRYRTQGAAEIEATFNHTDNHF